MGYAVRITSHAMDVVTGADKTPGIVAAEATGVGRKKWGGSEIRSRVVRQGSGWTTEGGSPYGSYLNTPVAGAFSNPGSPYPNGLSPTPGTHSSGYGLGLSSPSLAPSSPAAPPISAVGGFPTAATVGSPYQRSGSGSPYTPPLPVPNSPPASAGLYAHFPPTPNPVDGTQTSFPRSPALGSPMFPSQHGASAPPPPRRENGVLHLSNGSLGAAGKKDD